MLPSKGDAPARAEPLRSPKTVHGKKKKAITAATNYDVHPLGVGLINLHLWLG